MAVFGTRWGGRRHGDKQHEEAGGAVGCIRCFDHGNRPMGAHAWKCQAYPDWVQFSVQHVTAKAVFKRSYYGSKGEHPPPRGPQASQGGQMHGAQA